MVVFQSFRPAAASSSTAPPALVRTKEHNKFNIAPHKITSRGHLCAFFCPPTAPGTGVAVLRKISCIGADLEMPYAFHKIEDSR